MNTGVKAVCLLDAMFHVVEAAAVAALLSASHVPQYLDNALVVLPPELFLSTSDWTSFTTLSRSSSSNSAVQTR